MKKRALALLLSICVTFSVVPEVALAEEPVEVEAEVSGEKENQQIESPETEENDIELGNLQAEENTMDFYTEGTYSLTYTLQEDGTAVITGYEGTAEGDLVIPEEIDGYTVTGVAGDAFSHAAFDGSLSLPKSLRTIGNSAFAYCDKLHGSVIIPGGVEYIGATAFYWDYGFDGDLIIQEGVKEVGPYAFEKCNFTGRFELPSTLEQVASGAFSNMKLTDVYYNGTPDDWEKIAFRDLGVYETDIHTMQRHYTTQIEKYAVTLTDAEAFVYDGTEKSPKVLVKGLTEGADFSVSYADNVNAGTARVIVKGMGNYTGSVEKTYVICKADPVLSFEEKQISKRVGDKAFINPLNQTTDGSVVFSSSDDAVAQVDQSTGEVTIIGVGTATITAQASEGKNYYAGETSYDVTVAEAEQPLKIQVIEYANGKVTVDKENAKAGEKVTFQAIPDEEYKIDMVSVKDAEGTELEITEKGNGMYEVQMPEANIIISVVFCRKDIFVDQDDYVVGDFSYRVLEDGTAEITGIHDAPENVLVPSEIDGYKVSRIGDKAFDASHYGSQAKKIKRMIVSEGITSLGEFVFNNSKLIGVILPSSIEKIGEYSFCYAYKLEKVTCLGNISYIGRNAFVNCSKLEYFDFPDTEFEIATGAFGATGLRQVVVSDNWKFEKDSLGIFENCPNLEKVIIDSKTCSFNNGYMNGGGQFAGCSKLKSAGPIGSGANVEYAYDEKVPSNFFTAFSELETIDMPDTIKTIDSYTFAEMEKLKKVNLPSKLKEIGYQAFRACISLEHGDISDSVEKMGTMLFVNCTSLKSVHWPENYDNIPYGTFWGCTGLEYFKVPEGVLYIQESAFQGCSNLSKLIVPDTVVAWHPGFDYIIKNGEVDQYGGTLFECNKLITAGEIGSGSNIEFDKNCSTQVIRGVLHGVPSLEKIEFPEGIKEIPEIDLDINLEKVIIPSSAKSAGTYKWCDKILTAGPYGGNYNIEYKWDRRIPDEAFKQNNSVHEITIGSGITSIGEKAFYGCSNLEKVHIPYSVTEIGTEAFANCRAITSAGATGSGCDVELGEITKLPNRIFEKCNNLEKVYLPGTVKEIGDYCFDKTTITTFGTKGSGADCELGSVEKIGRFSTDVEEVQLPDTVQWIGDGAFSNCKQLTELELPDSVHTIGNSAFYECTGLDYLYIPPSVVSVGDGAFYNSSFSSAGPKGSNCKLEYGWKTNIPESAFQGMRTLEKVVLNKNIGTIGEKAFYNCDNLSLVNYEGSESDWKNISMGDGNDNLLSAKRYCQYKDTGSQGNTTINDAKGSGSATFDHNKVTVECRIEDSAWPVLRVSVENEEIYSLYVMNEQEKNACTTGNLMLDIILPEGVVFADTQSDKMSVEVGKLALYKNFNLSQGLTIHDKKSVEVSYHLYDNERIDISKTYYANTADFGESGNYKPSDSNADLANRKRTVIESGTYSGNVKLIGYNEIRKNSNVTVKGTLLVDGELVIPENTVVSADAVKITGDGLLQVQGTLNVSGGAFLTGNGSPSMELTGTMKADRMEVGNGQFLMMAGTGTVNNLTVKAEGALMQMGGNLIVSNRMSVSTSKTCELTADNLWLDGSFKQSWRNGNFQASGSHSTLLVRGSDRNLKFATFANKDIYFNNFYIDDAITGQIQDNLASHIRGNYQKAKIDLENRTYQVKNETELNSEADYYRQLMQMYEMSTACGFSDSYILKEYLGTEQYDLLRKTVTNWVVTISSPLGNSFTSTKRVFDYIVIDIGKSKICVYGTGITQGSYAMTTSFWWYGELVDAKGNVYRRSKENAQILGMYAGHSFTEFKRQAAVYLAKSMEGDYKKLLGSYVKTYDNAMTRLIQMANDYSSQYKKVKKILKKWNTECSFAQGVMDMPDIGSKTSTHEMDEPLSVAGSAEKKDVLTNAENHPLPEMHKIQIESQTVGTSGGDKVVFEDSALESAVREALQMEDNAEITEHAVSGVTELNLSDFRIISLKGLEAFTNLKKLDLSNNNFYDLAPLSGLTKMEELDLSRNRITDISPLEKLTGLKTLILADNLVENVHVLEKFPDLSVLDIQRLPLNDFSGIAKIGGLEQLNMNGTVVADGTLNFLQSHRKLTMLYAKGCNLTSTEGLCGDELQFLNLADNQLTVIPDIHFARLQSADFSENPLTNISGLQSAEWIEKLDLSNCNLNSDAVSALSGLKHLEQLSLCSNALSDVSFAKEMQMLRRLDICGNALTDLNGLTGKVSLEYLCAEYCGITDEEITALSGMNRLKTLMLCGNEISSTDFLETLSGLKYVDLSGNGLDEIDLTDNQKKYVHVYTGEESNPIQVRIMESATELPIGREETGRYLIYPEKAADAVVHWSSSNTDVIQVTEGGVWTVVGAGSADITIQTDNGKCDTITVKGVEPIALTFVTQPSDRTVETGDTVEFSVETKNGIMPEYQWQVSKNNGKTWNACSNDADSQEPILYVSAKQVMDGYQYRCVVADKDGSQYTSDAATLHVTGSNILETGSIEANIPVPKAGKTVKREVEITSANADRITGKLNWWCKSSDMKNAGSDPLGEEEIFDAEIYVAEIEFSLAEGFEFDENQLPTISVNGEKLSYCELNKMSGAIVCRWMYRVHNNLEDYKYRVDLSEKDYVYDGSEKKPKVSIDDLVEGKDFSVSYKDNLNAGTAQVIIEGIGTFKGVLTETFTIARADILGKKATLSQTVYTYDGNEKRPEVQVEGLQNGRDYQVYYINNRNVGTAKVNIWGLGNYNGTIQMTFTIKATETKPDVDKSSWLYDDVPEKTGWRYEAIKYVKDHGIMNGISGTRNFAPDEPLTRAMFATIIYRMEGSPKASYSAKFPDVPDGNYFSVPIIWANKAGIINGHSNTGLFGTRENITREDMVVIMYRYCKVKGLAFSGRADLGRFPDADQISGYAKEAVQWAVANGIIYGRSNTGMLDPKGNASRVETAAIIQRFMSKVKK